MVNEVIVRVEIAADAKKVWKMWNNPEDIMKWNHASEDWYCPKARNDLKVGGKFNYTMSAKDGSFSFDFEGEYTAVEVGRLIEYTIIGGRKVRVEFSSQGKRTKVVEIFEPENENPPEMQKAGWQAILDNFKKHVETN